MTKEEANKILSGYVKACNEDDFHALEMFEYKEVIEAMTMGARALSTLSLPSSLDDAAVKKARDIFESLDKHDVGEEKNRVLFGLLELEALALTFSHFGAEWKTGQEEEYGPYARQYPKSKVSQEQPEVDLDTEIDKFLYGTKFKRDYDGVHVPGVCVRDWKGKKYTNRDVTPDDMRNFARHFAEWGSIHLNAKKEE